MAQWIEVFNIVEFLAVGMLLGAVALVALTRIESLLRAYVGNSWLLAAFIGISAVLIHEPHLYVAAAFTVIAKGVLIPVFVRRIVRELKVTREVEPFVSTPFSLIIAFALVTIVYSAISGEVTLTGGDATILKISISIIIISLFVMISRRKAITQVISLLFLENGIFLAGFTLTRGMPTIIEFGILFDLLMGVVILGVFTVQIRKSFASVDLDRLTTLKG
jgi:hydrogenase-4 component E